MTWAKGSPVSKKLRQKGRQPQRTHTTFDGYDDVSLPNESCSALSKHIDNFVRPYSPVSRNEVIRSLLLLTFIEEKCKFEEKDFRGRRILFNAICQSLSDIGILYPGFKFPELDHILQTFRNGFSVMVANAQLDLQHSLHTEFPINLLPQFGVVPILRPFSPCNSYFDVTDTPRRSRYLEEFKELEVIGRGGFGIVCKARKFVDNCVYAVKKISFFYQSDTSLENVAREVEVLAKLNHPNIVTYKTAWIEYELQCAARGSSTRSSSRSSTDSDMELSHMTRYEYKKQDAAENISIEFLDEESALHNCDQSEEDISMEHYSDPIEYQVPDFSLRYNQRTSFATASNVIKVNFVDNCIKSCSRIDSELLETHCPSFKIQELESSSEISKEIPLNNWKMEDENEKEILHCNKFSDLDENGEICNYDDVIRSSVSRQRHGSGATCKSHSDAEIDDVYTVERKRSHSSTDFKQLPFFRCASVDTGCKLLPLMQPTNAGSNFHIPFSSLHLKGTLYIQMELCAESLRDWLDERDNREPNFQENIFDKICEKTVMSIFRQVLKGVEHIHSFGIIHRDLKPQNIFFDFNHSKVKIGDFGLAACYCSLERNYFVLRESNAHTVGVGTTPYAALEQKSGQSYDSMADMYSLGVILVELLHPFGTRMERAACLQKLSDGIIPIELKRRLPDKVAIIERLLNKDPQLRPSATEVLNSSVFLNKTQMIKRLQEEVSNLKQRLQAQDKMIEEKDKEIFKLKTMLKQY